MSHSQIGNVLIALAALGTFATGAPAKARPLYFSAFSAFYGFQAGDDLYACGVCHNKWEGTGVRNPFGTAVEQQLYIGKTVPDALLIIESLDSDGDGFTNVDELTVEGTLPGYSCNNYDDAQDTPPNFQSFITPGVPTCLEPLDIKVDPISVTLSAEVGGQATLQIEIENNGSVLPLNVSSVALDPGADPSLSISGPAVPVSIPLDSSILVDVIFAPPGPLVSLTSLQIVSDDPDEAVIDIPVSAFSFTVTLAPDSKREACFADIDRFGRKYAKKSLKEWGRCYLNELRGVACDIGRRNFKIAQAEGKFRDAIGGDRDRSCSAQSLAPSFLGLPDTCAAPCDAIDLTTMDDVVSCAVCTQEAGIASTLAASIGSVPPDLPANLLANDAHRCSRKLQRLTENGIRKISKELARCELDNITAATPADCFVDAAAVIAKVASKIDGGLAKCSNTTDMAGCLFGPSPDPACLSTVAEDVSLDLIESIFGAP